MSRVIRESVLLAATAEELYATYVDAARHAAVTGSAVTVSDRPGSKFSAFFGAITGTTLAVEPQRLVVQAWRSTNFDTQDANSTLVLEFVPEGQQGRINLIQIDVPRAGFDAIRKGWEVYYWTPWRRYLETAASG